MKLFTYQLKKRGEVFFLLIILLAPLINYSQNNQEIEEGIIRITFNSFPYVNDPYGADWRCYNSLGSLSVYAIRIYSVTLADNFQEANENSLKMTGKKGQMSVIIPNDICIRGKVSEAKELLKPENKKLVLELFNKGGGATIYVENPAPPFIDVPIPIGKYFLAYSLIFSNTKNPIMEQIHPNYKSKNFSTIRWGPPSLSVANGQIANIEFAPNNHACFYKYPEIDQGWENFEPFWDYIDYLTIIGELY